MFDAIRIHSSNTRIRVILSKYNKKHSYNTIPHKTLCNSTTYVCYTVTTIYLYSLPVLVVNPAYNFSCTHILQYCEKICLPYAMFLIVYITGFVGQT